MSPASLFRSKTPKSASINSATPSGKSAFAQGMKGSKRRSTSPVPMMKISSEAAVMSTRP
jgi:hypothetical protein